MLTYDGCNAKIEDSRSIMVMPRPVQDNNIVMKVCTGGLKGRNLWPLVLRDEFLRLLNWEGEAIDKNTIMKNGRNAARRSLGNDKPEQQ